MIEARIKKWGNSYGILLTKEEVRKLKLQENDSVRINVKKQQRLNALRGIVTIRESTEEIMKDIRRGYDD